MDPKISFAILVIGLLVWKGLKEQAIYDEVLYRVGDMGKKPVASASQEEIQKTYERVNRELRHWPLRAKETE